LIDEQKEADCYCQKLHEYTYPLWIGLYSPSASLDDSFTTTQAMLSIKAGPNGFNPGWPQLACAGLI
jgi:hypothetical protein